MTSRRLDFSNRARQLAEVECEGSIETEQVLLKEVMQTYASSCCCINWTVVSYSMKWKMLLSVVVRRDLGHTETS